MQEEEEHRSTVDDKNIQEEELDYDDRENMQEYTEEHYIVVPVGEENSQEEYNFLFS